MSKEAVILKGLVLVPLSLALLYAIAVQAFLAVWHECSWTFHISSLTLRLTFMIVALGISISTTDETLDTQLYTFIPVSILSIITSVVLIHRTRKLGITGPKPCIPNHLVKGRVFFITGANAGIGKETARQLLMAGATVVMACRSEERAREAMEDILLDLKTKEGGSEHDLTALKSPVDRLLFLKCDVSNYDSVRDAVKTFEAMNMPLHVLINNAGIMMGTRTTNNVGHELTMSANHLGHFLLTNLLLPKLQKEKDARVVVLTSSTYALARNGIDLDDLNCEKRNYTMFSQYAQSKLANIMFGKELAKREKIRSKDNPVKVFMVHPGLVRTDVVRNMPWYLKYPNMVFSVVLMTLQKTPEAGAYTSVYTSASELSSDDSGQYFSNSRAMETNAHTKDEQKSKDLWDLSCKLVGL